MQRELKRKRKQSLQWDLIIPNKPLSTIITLVTELPFGLVFSIKTEQLVEGTEDEHI